MVGTKHIPMATFTLAQKTHPHFCGTTRRAGGDNIPTPTEYSVARTMKTFKNNGKQVSPGADHTHTLTTLAFAVNEKRCA
jgi:hypothetical protein